MVRAAILQVEKDKQVHEERFNQTFPNLRMEKEARDFSEEERAQIAAAIAVFTDAAKNGDLDAFKRLRTLAFRGYHQAQWGCATIALAQGNKEVGLGYMNMLKNNTCEDISVEQDKESKQDAAALVLRRERAKELSGDEQAEEMAKIDEEVRMRFGKLPFDQYKADDVVALRELAENGSAPAQEAMWGYYVHKGDTVEAEQMSGMLKQNSSAHWEGNLGNSDSYKNLDEITAEVERQKKENQGMDTANMSNDLSNADTSTIENRVKDNEQENTIETAPKNQTSLASKPATVLEPSKDEIKTIQPPPPAKAKVDDDAANAAAVARKNKRGSAGNG